MKRFRSRSNRKRPARSFSSRDKNSRIRSMVRQASNQVAKTCTSADCKRRSAGGSGQSSSVRTVSAEAGSRVEDSSITGPDSFISVDQALPIIGGRSQFFLQVLAEGRLFGELGFAKQQGQRTKQALTRIIAGHRVEQGLIAEGSCIKHVVSPRAVLGIIQVAIQGVLAQ